jgi:hypothetical protein
LRFELHPTHLSLVFVLRVFVDLALQPVPLLLFSAFCMLVVVVFIPFALCWFRSDSNNRNTCFCSLSSLLFYVRLAIIVVITAVVVIVVVISTIRVPFQSIGRSTAVFASTQRLAVAPRSSDAVVCVPDDDRTFFD